MREVSFQTHNINSSAVCQNRSLDSTRVVDAGVCEPFGSQPVAVSNRSVILPNKVGRSIDRAEGRESTTERSLVNHLAVNRSEGDY